MAIQSAGILLYRRHARRLEIFLIHMGGPLWAKKDAAAWSIPKGVIGSAEDPLTAARREFYEETGLQVDGHYEPLGAFRQNSSKDLIVWAIEGDCDPEQLKSTLFAMVWPPHSGHFKEFPEADRGGWFARHEAMAKIVKGQQKILQRFFEQA
jgi:predicted NUDIX family NTP pyrophosphohydrolase